MTVSFPAGERISSAKEFQPDAITFQQYPDWTLDTILDFLRRIIIVPEWQSCGHYPCEPTVFRLNSVAKPQKWCFYMTEGSVEVSSEGIYPDDPIARKQMPEMPYYEDGDNQKVALYTDNNERVGNDAWIVGPFKTIDEAKKEWRNRCVKDHTRRWDQAHSKGRAEVAKEMKKRAFSVKAIAENCPAIATHEIPDSLDFCNPENLTTSIFPDPFTVIKMHADVPTLVGVRPIVESLSRILWVVTKNGADAFDSIRLAYLHASKMSKMGLRLAVVIAQKKGDALAVFKELVGRVEDKANDEAPPKAVIKDGSENEGQQMKRPAKIHPDKQALLESLLPTYLALHGRTSKEKAAFWTSFSSTFLEWFPVDKYPAPDSNLSALPALSAEQKRNATRREKESWMRAKKRRMNTPEQHALE
ncbi:hypothetical protein V5O48_017628, partial [Marasmius crinis-equi]